MIGDQQLKTIMDMMLNDKVYFSLFSLIQRYHNFQKTCDGITLNTHSQQKGFITADFWPDFMSISYQESKYAYRNSILSICQYSTNYSVNNLSVRRIEIYNNSKDCHTTPLRDADLDIEEYDFLWHCRDGKLDSEAESELFMKSTVLDTYSSDELHEIMSRMKNLPLRGNECLTIESPMCYYPSYKFVDELLWGY